VIEKTLQVDYINLLKKLELPFLHLTNKGSRSGVYHDSMGKPCLTDFPDLMFAFNGKMHFREFGIEGRHSDRKSRQLQKMKWWCENGGSTQLIITGEEGMRLDWIDLGLII